MTSCFPVIVFLDLSTVANPNVIKVLLPKASASQALTKQPVTLTITENKQYYINKQLVSSNELESAIVAACKNMPEPTVVLRIHHSLSVQDLVDVMQIGAKNKLKMVLATDKL